MTITQEQFSKLNTSCTLSQVFVECLNKYMPLYGINTPTRQAYFLAQSSHESQGFTRLQENLNYSAARLIAVFPKYFKTFSDATKVAGNPQAIANIVYANRMGNGDVASGDGWRHRGMGLIGITGKENQTQAIEACGLRDVSDLSTPDGAVKAACWWWSEHNMNNYSDNDQLTIQTKVLNGGTNGLDDRLLWLGKYKRALGVIR